ncbi:MAG: endonuclease domain-containing protein [Mycobacterium sp.]
MRRNRSVGSPRRPTTLSLRRIFDDLVDVFDDQCTACGLNPVEIVDHDHYTGIVRGLLCRECNHRIDGCVHVEDDSCYRAAYLNDPPAVRFGLRYPLSKRPKVDDLIRREILGFNFLDARLWPHSNPADWIWTPPPPNALDGLEAERRIAAQNYFGAHNRTNDGDSDVQ